MVQQAPLAVEEIIEAIAAADALRAGGKVGGGESAVIVKVACVVSEDDLDAGEIVVLVVIAEEHLAEGLPAEVEVRSRGDGQESRGGSENGGSEELHGECG